MSEFRQYIATIVVHAASVRIRGQRPGIAMIRRHSRRARVPPETRHRLMIDARAFEASGAVRGVAAACPLGGLRAEVEVLVPIASELGASPLGALLTAIDTSPLVASPLGASPLGASPPGASPLIAPN
jgi:hypothetical protein